MTLSEQLRKLNPGCDDCPQPCWRREERRVEPTDLLDFCDECDVRKQLEFYEESAKFELERRFPEGCEWSFESLSSDVTRVQRVDRSVRGKGYPRGVDQLTLACLDILRREEWRPVRIARWEADQKTPRE